MKDAFRLLDKPFYSVLKPTLCFSSPFFHWKSIYPGSEKRACGDMQSDIMLLLAHFEKWKVQRIQLSPEQISVTLATFNYIGCWILKHFGHEMSSKCMYKLKEALNFVVGVY